jgi:hypothetical protein
MPDRSGSSRLCLGDLPTQPATAWKASDILVLNRQDFLSAILSGRLTWSLWTSSLEQVASIKLAHDLGSPPSCPLSYSGADRLFWKKGASRLIGCPELSLRRSRGCDADTPSQHISLIVLCPNLSSQLTCMSKKLDGRPFFMSAPHQCPQQAHRWALLGSTHVGALFSSPFLVCRLHMEGQEKAKWNADLCAHSL